MTSIFYLHQDGFLSGSAISLANLLKALDRSRFEPHVVLARDGPARELFSPLARTVEVVPAHYYCTQPSPPFYTPEYFRNFMAFVRNRRLEDHLRRVHPDLVHINDKAMLCAGRAAARVGIPVIWHLRSAYAGGHSRLQSALSRAVIKHVARYAVAISEDEVEGFDDSIPVKVIYNTIDLLEADRAATQAAAMRRQLGIVDDEIAVGMVGLLNDQKGAWDFIRAAGQVQRQRPGMRFRFIMIAPIPGREINWGLRGRLGLIDKTHPEDQAWQLARESGIEKQLHITGRRSDVMNVLAAMDMVSVCYRMWAIGRPAFEAMSVGRPVIVNEGHSGRSGIVRHGETGLVVPHANPNALAQAMLAFADNPRQRLEMGLAGSSYARENFDAQKNARRIEAIYDEVCESRTKVLVGVTNWN